MILSCGHPPTVTTGCGTGEAILLNGDRICYECSDALARKHAETDSVIYAYLTDTGIRTWSGGLLATVTNERVRKVGFHGSSRTYFDAQTPDGRVWSGVSPGHGMYCTLRAKAKQPR